MFVLINPKKMENETLVILMCRPVWMTAFIAMEPRVAQKDFVDRPVIRVLKKYTIDSVVRGVGRASVTVLYVMMLPDKIFEIWY